MALKILLTLSTTAGDSAQVDKAVLFSVRIMYSALMASGLIRLGVSAAHNDDSFNLEGKIITSTQV